MLQKKKIVLWTAVIVLLVFLAVVLININKGNSSTYYYQGRTDKFSFQVTKNGNITQHVIKVYTVEKGVENQKLIPFDYGPKELEPISLEDNVNQKIIGIITSKNFIYITQDPRLPNLTQIDSVLAVQEIAKVTGTAPYSVFQIPTRAAYTYDDNSSKLAEIINCKYANSKISVILLKLGDENMIYSENECVIVEAKNGKDLRKAATKLVYHLLGVF
ncbi:hypothetical protein HYX18_03120 [Candidatus Woesearchaeota archaeon]|nr:hypothetical protein [Candidatus Woesearchaeota archaeon]